MKKLIVFMMAFLFLMVTSPMTFANSDATSTKVTAVKDVEKDVTTVTQDAVQYEATSVGAQNVPDSNIKNETTLDESKLIDEDTEAEGRFDGVFSTFAALVAIIPFIVQFFRKLVPNASSLTVQIISWFIGIGVTMFGWIFNMGFLADMTWWLALLYGLGASLAANGIFDTGLIEWVLSLFKIQPIKRK